MNSNITDFFRDPRLDNLDDPQQGAPQLDDLMDPVQPGPGKAPNKMARYYYVATTAQANAVTFRIPDTGVTFLKMVPEYWILRLSAETNPFTTSVGPLLIRRQGGDDVKLLLVVGQEKRIILPGSASWIEFTLPGYSLNPPTLIGVACAMTGYNPLEIL